MKTLLVLIFFALINPAAIAADSITGKVVSVADGDTISVMYFMSYGSIMIILCTIMADVSENEPPTALLTG